MTRRIRIDGRVLLLALVAALLPGLASALPPKESHHAIDVQGKWVVRDGNSSKLLEDYNIQTGFDARYSGLLDLAENRSLDIDLLGQTGEEQGYFNGSYNVLGKWSLFLGVQSWREYYNARRGRDTTSSVAVPGTGFVTLPQSSFFPGTDDSRFFFGNDVPSVDWITPKADFRYQFDSDSWHDVYADIYYRSVDGDMTLLKSGSTIPGVPPLPAPGVLPVPAAGPNSANLFSFAGRKNVDYDTISGGIGTRPSLGNINWQMDGSYAYSWLKNKTLEVNFREEPEVITPTSNQLENYQEDTKLQVAKFNLAGGRSVNRDVYVFGAALFDWSRSDPEPNQDVFTDGGSIFFPTPLSLRARSTNNSEVTRYGGTMSLGTVWQPVSSLTVTATTRAHGHLQDGDLLEFRNESALPDGSGNFGTIQNTSTRDTAVSTTRIQADWRPMRSVSVKGLAQYRYRWDNIDTTRDLNLTPVGNDEIEDYDNNYHDARAGFSGKWRFKRGRFIEAGYEFRYRYQDTTLSQIQNQFILGDYRRWRHRPYLKTAGKLFGNLRGELRFHYLWEYRNMDAPFVDVVIVPPARGKTRWQGWAVTPMLYYTQETWNLFGKVAVGESSLDVVEGGPTPPTAPLFNDFDYDAFTTTFTFGAGYAPSKTWGINTSYTFFNNWSSVQNQGHNIFASGDFQFNDTWGARTSFRYLKYDLSSGPNSDDYQAFIPYLAVTAEF